MSSHRVRRDAFGPECDIVAEDARRFVAERQQNGKWRIYETWSDYSTTSGGFCVRGQAVRRYDSEAGDQEGRIAQFDSLGAARAYAQRWLQAKPKPSAARPT